MAPSDIFHLMYYFMMLSLPMLVFQMHAKCNPFVTPACACLLFYVALTERKEDRKNRSRAWKDADKSKKDYEEKFTIRMGKFP